MQKLMGVFALVFLSGCVGQDMGNAVEPYIGRPIKDMMAKIGMPDRKGVQNDRPYYEWSYSQVVPNAPTPVVTRSTGTINGQPFTYTQTTMESTGNGAYECQIRAFVDDGFIVRYIHTDGNYGGCGSYISRLRE